MEEIAFATRTSKEHYEFFFDKDIDALYQLSREKGVFPVRASFDDYLLEAQQSPQGFISLKAEELEDDYFEVLLGNSRAVAQALLETHLSYLKERLGALASENKHAADLLVLLSRGTLSVEQLKKMLEKANKGAVNA